jgi:hypothetical protein
MVNTDTNTVCTVLTFKEQNKRGEKHRNIHKWYLAPYLDFIIYTIATILSIALNLVLALIRHIRVAECLLMCWHHRNLPLQVSLPATCSHQSYTSVESCIVTSIANCVVVPIRYYSRWSFQKLYQPFSMWRLSLVISISLTSQWLSPGEYADCVLWSHSVNYWLHSVVIFNLVNYLFAIVTFQFIRISASTVSVQLLVFIQ